MVENLLVKSLFKHDVYAAYRNLLQKEDFSSEVYLVLQALDHWHSVNNGDCNIHELTAAFFSSSVKDKDQDFYKQVFQALDKIEVTETVLNLLESIKNRRICRDIAVAASEAAIGSKPVQSVLDLFEEFKSAEKQIQFTPVSDNIEELLAGTILKPGLRWRLNILNRSLGSLRPGYFGYIFARPDSGKTSFLASESTYMAVQAIKQELGPVLYFCNEELGERVKIRCIQAAFGVELEKIISNPSGAQEAWDEKFNGQYKVFHNSHMTYGYIEKICKQYNPSLILVDQMDKVKGFDDNRDDLRLGQIYEWGRGLCNQYGPLIAACQADGSAEGIDYLNMGHTSNAKTSKQAEADWILGMGKKLPQEFANVRYLSICKNKLPGDSDTEAHLRQGRFEIIIKPGISRYEDIG
ncbi:MAG: hypothetical protein ACRCST_04335 [Turicibacter sp.]